MRSMLLFLLVSGWLAGTASPILAQQDAPKTIGDYISGLANQYRCMHRLASRKTGDQWVTGYPTFEHGPFDDILGGHRFWESVLLKEGVVELQLVSQRDLLAKAGFRDFPDDAARFRCAWRWARDKGYAGGFPNFEQPVAGELEIVCLKSNLEAIRYFEVKADDLNAVEPDFKKNADRWVRAATRWARDQKEQQFIGAIPSFEEGRDADGKAVFGVLAFTSAVAASEFVGTEKLLQSGGVASFGPIAPLKLDQQHRDQVLANLDDYVGKIVQVPTVARLLEQEIVTLASMKEAIRSAAEGEEPLDMVAAEAVKNPDGIGVSASKDGDIKFGCTGNGCVVAAIVIILVFC